MNQKLAKLDLLDKVIDRLNTIENKIANFEQDLTQVKNRVSRSETNIDGNYVLISSLEQNVSELQGETKRLSESLLDSQMRGMKYNLIFSGIPESDDQDNENCEVVLTKFISDQLGINKNIQFQNIHRLRRRRDGKPRSIIARFVNYVDMTEVLNSAPLRLKDTNFSINPQYPPEINARRSHLFPLMKEAKKLGLKAKLKLDKLYVNETECESYEELHRIMRPVDQRNDNSSATRVKDRRDHLTANVATSNKETILDK
ncbi:hypothetical protein SNE40_020623 [Patella caerulea]|uniref:Uncharacterized protein n=1 Tax=Patella caerulea TaxID=87958 RepID=A0AAN8J5M4_PATCE